MTAPIKPIICTGHRGAAGHAPENTLLSIRTALDMGAEWIEIDVYSVHGEIIVIHDRMLDRTTSGRGSVYKRSLSYIRAVKAGNDQHVPLLSEVFDLVDQRAGLNIELKGINSAVAVGHALQKQIRVNGWPTDRFIVSSFQHIQLKKLRECFPNIPIGLLYHMPRKGYTAVAVKMQARAVHIPWQFTRKRIVNEAHNAGLSVFVYTVNRRATMRRLMRIGVDGIISDYPDRIIEERERYQIIGGN